MTKEEIMSAIDDVELEMRSLIEDVKDTSKDINLEEVRAKKEELAIRKSSLTKELAQLSAPVEEKRTATSGLFNAQEWIKAAQERRSFVIGSSNIGSINQIKTLFNEIAETDDILNKASYYYGKDASTNIPVLTPMADPSDYEEGATNVTKDTQAKVTVTEITPKAYSAILPISAEMLTMGSVNLESELPNIFAKAFRNVMHKGMLQGAGTNKLMKGVWTSASANTAGITTLPSGQSKIKLSDLAGLALKVSSKDTSFEIVMNPQTYQAILSDSTEGEDVKLYKEGLIRDKSIEGVKIRLDAQAPNATSSGSVLAVAVPLNRYAIGVAGQLNIKPIDVLGDTNTYFQATMFFSGKQISDTDLYSIAVA